jgi:TonB-linked SusC/RagA family outer membrane protein
MEVFGKGHVLPGFFSLFNRIRPRAIRHHQMLLAMKLTVFLLTVALAQAQAAAFSQNITLSGKDLPLKSVFKAIKAQTGYTFFYNNELLKEARPVTLNVKDALLEIVLNLCFKDQPLGYDIQNKTVFVTRRVEAPRINSTTVLQSVDSLPPKAIKVKGMVLTEAGVPVQGANVTIKQSEKGTTTNARGEFELSAVVPGNVLVFSFVGYAPQNFIVKDGNYIRVYMKVAQDELDKAVVQAYGNTTQRLTTSDIGTVTAEEIERVPVMNPLLALEGKVAGLDVTMTSGYASAPVKVELRGRADINPIFTSDPLYIIDGVPLTVNELSVNPNNTSSYPTGSVGFDQLALSPAGGQSPFFSINPADIESIQVLKDADATAIYGSRGANGVILVTTKKGKAGKTIFNLNVQDGMNRIDRFWDMMNTSQYLAMRRQAFYNSGSAPSPINDYDVNGTWDTTRYTNWQKVLFGGMGRDINVQTSLSGGDSRTTFRVGGGYGRSTGITTVSGADQRASVSLSLSHNSLDNKLNINSSSSFSYTQSDMVTLPGNILMPPDAPPIYDSLGNLNWAGWGGENGNSQAENAYPFGGLKRTYTGKTNFLNSNLIINYLVIKGLKVAASFGYNIGDGNQVVINPIAAQNPLSSPTGNLVLGDTRNSNWIFEPQLIYNSWVNKGKVDILLGASLSQNNTEAFSAAGSGYTSDILINNLSSAPIFGAGDNYGEYKYFGIFGRVTYNWENTYIFNLNARRDGSSRFGPGKQFGDFGSIGAAWIVSEERWLKNILPVFVSFVKVRGSYGTTGSDAVPNYSYLSQYVSYGISYNNQSALTPSINPDPNFRWQSNRKIEGALNLGFVKDRVNIQAAWYRDRCGNQLVSFPTPNFTGFNSVIENSPALVQNVGWEFTVSANLIRTKKFNWSLNFNTAINQNKLVAYPDFTQSPYIGKFKIGQPLNMQYALHYIGVDPATGQYSYFDRNHDGYIQYKPGEPQNGDDSYIVHLAPKFFGGAGMNFGYGALNVNLFFNIKDQIGKNAFINIVSPPGNANSNAPAVIFGKQWQRPGEAATVAKFMTNTSQWYQDFQMSDGAYTDASFVRLSSLSVSYSLPSSYLKKAGMQNCNIFFNTNNLLLITKYKGIDPETQNFGSLPPTKTIVGGISFNF